MERGSLTFGFHGLFIGSMLTASVWAAVPCDGAHKLNVGAGVQADVLATAFGYQNDESSTVLVKTFDPKTGALLSENSFTLPGVEETALNQEAAAARVLAGGARISGHGALSLSLRVYDARSGRYLHNVNLNVAPDEGTGALPTPVIGMVPTRGIVRLTSDVAAEPATEEVPMFSIRAVDPANDNVVWQTEFESAEQEGGKAELMRYRLLPRRQPVVKDQKYDFQIRMYNHRTGDLIWKDASSLLVKPAGSPTREDETLGKILPTWPSEESTDPASEPICDARSWCRTSEWRL